MVLFQAECDVIVIYSVGALRAIFYCWFWKGNPDFILVLHCNYTSIVHRFRYNYIFMFAGNDVIAISSLGGASGNFSLRILKWRPQLHIHVQLKLFFFWNCLYFGGISLPGATCWRVLGSNDPQIIWEKNTCWEGTPARQTASLEPLCVILCSSVWPVKVR